MTKSLLIIFAKNPTLGNVKTRLANTVGNEKALAIYHLLLTHSIEVTSTLLMDKVVYYSDFIDTEDKWDNAIYKKDIQKGAGLGERMQNAFDKGFKDGYEHICIIGTDNLEINTEIIENGFESLNTYDITIGPAHDGGYYLLGMKKLHKDLFENKTWSTSSVFNTTITDLKKLNLSYTLLPILNDIDTEEDWEKTRKIVVK